MRIKTLFLFCQCLIICSRCNYANALTGRYVRNADENEFPYVVGVAQVLSLNPLQAYKLCVGTLISRKDVLTSEHCLLNQNSLQTLVIAGSVDILYCNQYRIYWWLSYNQWMIRENAQPVYMANDLTMIRLLSIVTHIVPASISNLGNHMYYGSHLTLATWTRTTSGHLETIMHVGTVRVLSQNECETRVGNLRGRPITIPERLLCTAADPPLLLNEGDEGGPLLYENTVVGINNGIFPDVGPLFHPQKVNIHYGIHFYRNYILAIVDTA